jgi:WD40 repeat protein
MSPDDRVLAATAEVRVRGRRLGTGVLVDDCHLLTAHHVLNDPAELSVRFPGSGITSDVEVVTSDVLEEFDIAVLRVPDVADLDLPEPIGLWPDDRLPTEVEVFGFPRTERESHGVWRPFTVSGRTTSGFHQLRWDDEVGTHVGHSGGPVVEAVTRRLVGVLLAGSEDGRFDRFVALPRIAELWPDLVRPWASAGPSAESHFRRASQGHYRTMSGGDLFRGRDTALDAITAWLAADAPGCPLVVTGQPGSGKSVVLARAALHAQRTGGRGLLYHAQGSSVPEFSNAVAALVGLPASAGIEEIVDHVGQRDDVVTVVVDALDEARSVGDARKLADAITALSGPPSVRVVVATRPLATANRFSLGSILQRLDVADETSDNLIDLDAPAYRDRGAIQSFADAMLARLGADHPGPRGRAWESYRADDDLRTGLSKFIAERADPNFLVAAITASTLSVRGDVIDWRDPAFHPDSLPSDLGEALEKYYSSLDDEWRLRVTGMLTALAYARGTGITEDRWMAFARALGYDVKRIDVDEFRKSPGIDFLIQAEADNARPVIRLFHRALVDHLRSDWPEPDEQKVFACLLGETADVGGWARADSYLRSQLADHALAAGRLPELVADRDFIGVADVAPLISALGSLNPGDCPEIGHLILQEGLRLAEFGPNERLWLLALSATHAGQHATRDHLLGDEEWDVVPEWAQALGSTYRKLTGHTGAVHALAVGRLGWEDVILAGGADRTIRVWDSRGTSLLEPLTGHQDEVTALAVGFVDGEDVVVSGSADRTVRLWDQRGSQIACFSGHTTTVRAVRVIKFLGEDAILSAAPEGEILVRNPEGHLLRSFPLNQSHVAIGDLQNQLKIAAVGYFNLSLFSPVDGHESTVSVQKSEKTALSIGTLGNSDVIACGFADGTIMVWRMDGAPTRGPLQGLRSPPRSVAVGVLDGLQVVASAGANDSIVIWDFRGNIHAEPWRGHVGTANVVTVGSLRGRDVVVCGGEDHTVRFWDGRTLRDHRRTSPAGRVKALWTGVLDGAVRVLAGRDFGWEMRETDGTPLVSPSEDQGNDIGAITAGRLPRGEVVVTASRRGPYVLRLWDTDGEPLGDPIAKHPRPVTSLTTAVVDGQGVIVSVSSDRSIRVWGEDGTLMARVRDPNWRGVKSLTAGQLGGRACLVFVCGDHFVRVWDLQAGELTHRSPGSSWGAMTGLALATIDGHDVVAVGGLDGRVRTWQPGQPSFREATGNVAGRVTGLAFLVLDRTPVLVGAGADGSLVVWHDLGRAGAVPLREPAMRVAAYGRHLVLGCGPGLAVARLASSAAPRHAGVNDPAYGFTSKHPLPDDDRGDGMPPEDEAVRQSISEHVNYVRTSTTLSAGEAVDRLLPHLAHVTDALCYAADRALRSGERPLLDVVYPHLLDERTGQSLPVRARLFLWSVLTDRLDIANRVVEELVSAADDAVVELTRAIDGPPDWEWSVYTRGTRALLDGTLDRSFLDQFATLVAMRLLAVCRREAEPDVKAFEDLRVVRCAAYWTWFGREGEQRLIDVLLRYLQDTDDDDPTLLPHQVLSIYEVLLAAAPNASILADRLADRLTATVSTNPYHRMLFRRWTSYSSLAGTVVRGLR